ncbi:MAG: thymidine phosphorylase [Chloroflexia bacterium]
MSTFSIVDLILKKKAGQALSTEEITSIVQGYTQGRIPDYQMAAWLMAVCWQGMDERETTDLTLAMARSGQTLDLHDLAPIIVDKHSTGGVGDKTSLVLAPLVASCGLTVAKMSGRGLGFSGGTMDKLESIPGFRAELSPSEFREVVRRVGLAITGQSADLAPADKKIYALRDVTGTVDSLPLIASSIMSKKLAAGSDCIVLDVKVGRGAFMPTLEKARALAQMMVQIGRRAGRKVSAVLSSMDQPLGRAVGNALELREALQTLQGQGPDDLLELCLTLGSLLLQMAGTAESNEQARAILLERLRSGAAWEKFCAFIAAQGGDVDLVERLPQAQLIEPFPSPQDGYVAELDARRVAEACLVLGAGRMVKDAPIDHAVGVVLQAKIGDPVHQGQPVAVIHANDGERLAQAHRLLSQAFQFSPHPVPPPPLILEIVA